MSTISNNQMLDEPIGSPDHDLIGRSSFAKSIADFILAGFSSTSVRIGVFGEWGTGKTSVLRLIEHQMKAGGHHAIWLPAWTAESTEDIRYKFLCLAAKEVKVPSRWFRVWTWMTSLLRTAKSGSEIDWKVKIAATVFARPAERLNQRSLQKLAAQLNKALTRKLGQRRLIVFVDDLDRTRPDLLPSILMTLREGLDLPGVAYVLALSPRVVSKGLQAQHQGWPESQAFIEKIIEIPYYLPNPTPSNLRRLFDEHSRAIPDRYKQALNSIADLIPPNPRKIKLFLRIVAGNISLLSRFSGGEVSPSNFFMLLLLRMEFPDEFQRLQSDKSVRDALDSVAFARTEPERQEKLSAVGALLNRSKELEPSLLAFLESIAKHWSPFADYPIETVFEIFSNPPLMTRAECIALCEETNELPPADQSEHLRQWLNAEGRQKELADEFVGQLLKLRNSLLEHAVDRITEDDVERGLASVEIVTRLLRRLIQDLALFRTETLSAETWIVLLQHVAQWSAWRSPDHYLPTRKEELDLLRSASQDLSEGLQIEIVTNLRSRLMDPIDHFPDAPSDEFSAVREQVVQAMERTFASRLLKRFHEERGIEELSSVELSFLLDPGTAFNNEEYRGKLMTIMSDAQLTAIVHQNAVEYLRVLLSDASASSSGRAAKILRDPALRRSLWTAAFCRRLNPRVQKAIVGRRESVIAGLGFLEDDFPLPGRA